MEIAPLIHSRTFYCDFSQNFAARPNGLNIQWAMNKILPAMRDVDILNGVRRMFATDGKTCIAGISCNFKSFAEKYLSAAEYEEAEKYFHDERGREVKIFLGYAFKGSGVPDVSNSKLWQMFKQTVAKVWNNNPAETVIVPYESCGVKSVAKRPLDKKFYPSNERDDVEMFEQCLAERKDFCSNVDAVKIFEDGKYEVITAAQSIINRIQEAQKKTQPPPSSKQDQPSERPFQAQHTQNRKASSASDGKSLLIPIVAIVAVIAIIIFLTQ
ncbi:MAG: hypothetical protein IJK81_04270 [Selenomonadaceae bacterium]|nr:hypothetical protein [Selenomonadaceae bacterium]